MLPLFFFLGAPVLLPVLPSVLLPVEVDFLPEPLVSLEIPPVNAVPPNTPAAPTARFLSLLVSLSPLGKAFFVLPVEDLAVDLVSLFFFVLGAVSFFA